MVSFGIADADDVMGGETEFTEGGSQPCRLVDARRQDHYCPFIENHLQFEPEIPNNFNHRRFVGAPGRYNDAADGNGLNPASNKFVDKIFGRALRKLSLFASRGPIQ